MTETVKYPVNTLQHEISSVSIRIYHQEDMEYIISRHRKLYEEEYGFSSEFGDYVEKYILMFDKCHDENKENIWIAEEGKKPVGVIAVVCADDSTAQLRWFLIEPEVRNRGLGHKLIETAIDFCRKQGYNHIFLWTVSTLLPARHLYRRYGFVLTETKDNNIWADNLTEERWDLY